MANNRLDLLQSLSAGFCTCSLCGNAFTLPLVLPCFHTFCTNCLEGYISKQVTENRQHSFECPTCLRPSAIPSGSGKGSYTDSFKPDTFITKLLEVMGAFRDQKSCDICKRRKISLPASDWCMDCSDATCENCTKVHLCGKTTCDHVVISLEELRKLSLENIMKRTISHKCANHEEDVKLYCLSCKAPVCVQCLASAHRKCDNCISIPEAMKTVEEDVAEVMVKLRSLTNEASGGLTTHETGADVLEESVKKTQAEIKSLADDLRRRIDKSEQVLLERLHSIGTQLKEKVGDFRNLPDFPDVTSLMAAQKRMEVLMKYGSDMEVLNVYSDIKEKLCEVDEINSSMTSSIDDEVRLKVNFDTAQPVKVFSREFETLGEIRVEDSNPDEGLCAWGVTVTAHDEIIVADCRNRRVQKFGSTGDLIDHIQISEEPRDITTFGSKDMAITIMKKQIFIVTLTSTMVLKRRIMTQKQYEGIAYSQSMDYFLVSSLEDNCIDVISTQGDVIKTFNFSGSAGGSEPIFEIPRYVAFTKEGHYIISDAAHNSVTCITQDGGLRFSYSPSGPHELKRAQGICCDKIGNLFVGDYSNSRIHLLTSDGTFQRFVLGRESGLCRPVALAMTQSNKLVVVQSDGMVKIFSYENMKVKVKVPCWCPRCVSNTDKDIGNREVTLDEGHQGRGDDHRGRDLTINNTKIKS